MVSCLMGDSTALASAIVRCCLKFLQKKKTINFSFEINCLSYVLFDFPK